MLALEILATIAAFAFIGVYVGAVIKAVLFR
jgi:hypothetical protein